MLAIWRPSRAHPDRLHLLTPSGQGRCGVAVVAEPSDPTPCALCVLLADGERRAALHAVEAAIESLAAELAPAAEPQVQAIRDALDVAFSGLTVTSEGDAAKDRVWLSSQPENSEKNG